jgi:MFS family permease
MRLKPFQLFIVYFPALLIDFAFSSVLSNSSFYTSYLRLSSTFLGVLVAIATAFYAFLAIPLGQLSDRVERRRMLYTGCLLISAVSCGLIFCKVKIHLVLIFPWIGISMALFWPAYEAWLAEREGEGKLIHRVMLFNLFWSTGITLGPTVSGYLYRDVNPFKPFYLAAAVGLFTIIAIFLCKTKPIPETEEKEGQSIEALFPTPAVRRNYLNMARCANFASWFALGVLRWLAPKLTKEMGILPTTFGNLMLALGGVQTLTFLFLGTGYSTRWHYRLGPLLIVQGLAILSFVGIWRFQHTILWMCAFAVIGVSVAFTYFGSLYYGLDRHIDKGNKSGWHEAVLGVGSLLGPFIGGIAADSRLGPQSPYLICAVVIVIAIGVEIIIASRNRLSADVP